MSAAGLRLGLRAHTVRGAASPLPALGLEGLAVACVQLLTVLSTALLVGWATRKFLPAAAKPVYLIDTYTYKPPDRCGCCLVALAFVEVHPCCV